MPHRTLRGKIHYTSKRPERLDRERGREYFVWVCQPDGSRTLTAHCEIDDPPAVVRDVVYSVDPRLRPRDAFVRLTVGGRFLGAGFFRVGADALECESYGPGIGRISQHIEPAGPYAWFGTHPISADGFNTCAFDRSAGPARRLMRSYLPSLDHRGASAPLIEGHEIWLEYLGDEIVTVRAGTFATHHYQFVGQDGDPRPHPPYDLWVTADDDHLFVRGEVRGYMQTHYELVELER
jgi:hypothetical protein